MTDHRKQLTEIIKATPEVMEILAALRALALPDAWVVSGALYQTVWNHLTGRDRLHGLKDYDAIYFNGDDLSYEAEDAQIKRLAAALPHLADRLELRNQARVHLWYPDRFGSNYPELTHATQSLHYYACTTHAVAARLTDKGEIGIIAPFGLAPIFDMRLVPNYALDNSATHRAKCERMKALWPELIVEPWIVPETAC